MMAIVWSVAASASPLPKEKEKEHEGKKIDSGSFGVFQNGHRVGTETFSIYQISNGSVIESEFKTENTPPDVQTSEMRLTAAGDIRRYEWKELSPGRAESVVVPNDDFLTQKWSAGPQEKEHDQPYLLPAVDQHPGRLLLHPPRSAGMEVSGHGLQTGQRASAVPAEATGPVRNHQSRTSILRRRSAWSSSAGKR